jgi:hypothetical protein
MTLVHLKYHTGGCYENKLVALQGLTKGMYMASMTIARDAKAIKVILVQ